MTNPGNAVGTNGAYGGRSSVNSFNDILSAFSGPGIISGWKAVPGGALNVKLGGEAEIRDVAIVENNLGQRTTLDNISTQPIEVELEEAPSAGQRIDVIVGYVNNPPDAVVTDPIEIDNPSVCGLIAVTGNVSNNPTAPTESMIQTAITADGAAGQAAYYVVLATITIPAGLTTITAANIAMGKSATLGSTALADGSVTNQKIEDGAVTRSKLEANLLSELTNLRTYTVNPDSNGVLNITDSSLPSTPVDGLQFLVRPSTATTNAKISLNGGAAVAGVVQAPVGGRSTAERNSNFSLDANSWYLVVFCASYWRFVNTFDVIRTHDIVDGAISTTKLADGAVTAPKLAQTGMYSPQWQIDFAVSDDTPNGWRTALGSKNGRYWNYYDTTGKFAGQPAQYGFLETIIKDANIVQNWYEQTGITKTRGGNANGWLSGGWKQVMHDGDYGIGADALSVPNSNCNDIPGVTGFWSGWSLTNAPNEQHWLIVQICKVGYRVQIACNAYSNSSIFKRVRNNSGSWSSWTHTMSSGDTLNQVYPVGSMYESQTLDTPAKVAAALGGGTWVASAVGRTIVGYDSSQTEFNNVSTTGGAKTVTLTTQQIPSHNHALSIWKSENESNAYGLTTASDRGFSGRVMVNANSGSTSTANTGGGQAHSNLQPYIVRYVYTRTA